MKILFFYFLILNGTYIPMYTMELPIQSLIDQRRLAESFTHIAPSTIPLGFEQLITLFMNHKTIAPSLIPKTVLVFGKQGTGKTSLINGFAQYMDATINSLFIPELIMTINHKPQHVKNIHDVINHCCNETIAQATSSGKSMAIIHLDKCHYLKNSTALAHGIVLEDLISIMKKRVSLFPTLLMVEYENVCPPSYLPKFDQTIHINEPTTAHIKPIMEFHTIKTAITLNSSIDWEKICSHTNGLTGNLLQKIIHKALIATWIKRNSSIQESDLLQAIKAIKKLQLLCDITEKKAADTLEYENQQYYSMYS